SLLEDDASRFRPGGRDSPIRSPNATGGGRRYHESDGSMSGGVGLGPLVTGIFVFVPEAHHRAALPWREPGDRRRRDRRLVCDEVLSVRPDELVDEAPFCDQPLPLVHGYPPELQGRRIGAFIEMALHFLSASALALDARPRAVVLLRTWSTAERVTRAYGH